MQTPRRMLRWIFMIVLIPVQVFLLQAQVERTWHWQFGDNAALDFSSGSPVVQNGIPGYTLEGMSSIADQNGNMQFCTNGMRLYNRNYQVMPHGDSLPGHWSSAQSALIIPRPASHSRYFVFFTDEQGYENPPNDGFHFTEVDMTLDSGRGDVIASASVKQLLRLCDEKLTAVKGCGDAEFYWVTVHSLLADTFFTYRIDASGVDTVPVINRIGAYSLAEGVNCMKYSPDGSMLAGIFQDSTGIFHLGLLDMDRQTGQLSNYRVLDSAAQFFPYMYSVEFSPDNSRLYYSTQICRIKQFDLSSGNTDTIRASGTVIYEDGSGTGNFGTMQMGPDGKIYVARSGFPGTDKYYMGVIQYPNLTGSSCQYDNHGLYLSNLSFCYYGLPNFVTSFFSIQDTCHYSDVEEIIPDLPRLYPNPASDFVSVTLPDGIVVSAFRLTDMQGRYMYRWTVHFSGTVFLPVQQLEAGLYFLIPEGIAFPPLKLYVLH